jgi:hypothetical protein
MEEIEERDLKKIELIYKLLEERLENKNQELVYFSFKELTCEPLLQSHVGIKKIFNLIQNNSAGHISFEIKMGRLRRGDMAGQTGAYPDSTNPLPIGIEIYLSDPKKLKKYFQQVITKVARKKSGAKKIEMIEIFKPENDSKALIIINGNYSDKIIKANVKKGYWKKLFEVAESGTTNDENAKSLTDYFNTNEKCRLYSNSEYILTEILTMNQNEIFPAIKIKTISSKTFEQRKNKSKIA